MCVSAPRFSANALARNHNPRPSSRLHEQHQEIVPRESDASRGRRVSLSREMHKDGAAAAANAGQVVIAEHDDEIVEMVSARETVAVVARRQFDRPVIVRIARILAPAIEGPDRAQWQRTARAGSSIRAIKHLPHGKAPDRRRAVAFAFQRREPRPAKGSTVDALPNQQQRLLRPPRRRPDHNGPRAPNPPVW